MANDCDSDRVERVVANAREFGVKHPEIACCEDRERVLAEQGIDVPPYSQAENGSVRRVLGKHALRSEAHGRVAGMLELAKTDARIAILPEEFDGPDTRYLLNVLSGTLDLRTGEIRHHSPRDLITKLAPVTLDPAIDAQREASKLLLGRLGKFDPQPASNE